MNLFDHTLVFLFAIVYPVASFISFRRLLRRVAEGESVNRSELYRNTFIGHWSFFLILMVAWAAMGRPWSALGISLNVDIWFGIGALLTVLGIVALIMQIRHVRALSQDKVLEYREKIGHLSIMIPQNGNELARFYGLSVTAGIVEEIVWRGYLIWYLSQFMPVWAAAIVTTVGFGLAHAYQGPSQLPHITAVGAAFAGLYLLTGSIWLPIILHTAIDVCQGRLAYDVMFRSAVGENSPPDDGNESLGLAGSSSQ